MKIMISEYGTTAIAVGGAMAVFALLRTPLLTAGGMLYQMLSTWIMHGC